jgi:hypothetical protein
MTLTNPDQVPTLLETVIGVEHARIGELVVELSRGPDTPGVWEDLVAGLRREVAAHLRAERRVVSPEVHAVFGDADARRWDAAADGLEAALGGLDHDHGRLAEIADALHDHIAVCEGEVLPRLRSSTGTKRMAQLGYDYGELRAG